MGFVAALRLRQKEDSIEVITVTDSSKKFLPFDLTPLYIQRSYEAELSIVPDALASFEAFEKGEGETTKSSICEYVNDALIGPTSSSLGS